MEIINILVKNGACNCYFSYEGKNLQVVYKKVKSLINALDFDEVLESLGNEEENFNCEDYIISNSKHLILVDCKNGNISKYKIPANFKSISNIIIAPNII